MEAAVRTIVNLALIWEEKSWFKYCF
jgi:hypothetical protein